MPSGVMSCAGCNGRLTKRYNLGCVMMTGPVSVAEVFLPGSLAKVEPSACLTMGRFRLWTARVVV